MRTITSRARKSSSSSAGAAGDTNSGGGDSIIDDIEQGGSSNSRRRTYSPPAAAAIILTLTKDAIIGIFLGVLFLQFLFLLDYRNIISIGSTRAFKLATIQLLSSDPSIISNIETSLQIKLLPLEVYTAMVEEIHRNNELMNDNSTLVIHNNKLKEYKLQKGKLQAEYDTLMLEANTKLGLDAWCGSCKGGWGNCDERVAYLNSNYEMSSVKAKIEIMKTGKCVK
jgi:hypothetical protein